MEPASIRCRNPGAMWGRVGRKPETFFPTPVGPNGCDTNAPIPLKWGSSKTIYLSDGLGQDNNIAIFDTWVQGICAQLDLWRASPKYRGKTFAEAINTWDGGNNTESYIAYVMARVPGMTRDTVMDDDFWSSPLAIGFLKAQAGHEAGKPYPAPDADWLQAQRLVMSGAAPAKPKPVKHVAAAATAAAGTAAAAAHAGWSTPSIVAVALIAAGVVAIVVTVIVRSRES